MIDTDSVRVEVYRRLAETGRAPSAEELADALTTTPAEVRRAFHELADRRHLVLDGDTIVLAHPFATKDFGFSVKSATTLWWGGCAWDAFAIPHLVADAGEVLIATVCPACRTPHAWLVDRAEPPAGDQVAHFLVPMRHVWDDVVHTCQNQRIFCDEVCVERWLRASGESRGDIFDLATLWRLASGWYAGRLDHGYTRREPREAAEYFRSVGLSGAFWGA